MTGNLLLGNRQEISLKDERTGWFRLSYLFLGPYIKMAETLGDRFVEATREFRELFANVSLRVEHERTTTFISYDLTGVASGFGIRCELSENPNQFCWILYRLLSLQPKGQPGFLLTSNTSVNLFFVKVNNGVFMIRVVWQGKEWELSIDDETGYHPALHFSHKWNPEHVEVRVFDRNEQVDSK